MGCELVRDPNGILDHMWMCGEDCGAESCSRCPQIADVLCDFPVGDGRTCDIPLCADCAVQQMPGRIPGVRAVESIDYCPQHALIAQGLVQTKIGRS